MKPAEEAVRDKFGWLCDSLPVEHYEWLIVEIGSLIHQDREAVRKKCAEVVKNIHEVTGRMYVDAYEIAKAIEEMEL